MNILQTDLNCLVEWCKVWLMDFNLSKCKYLCLGSNCPARQYTMGSDAELHHICATSEKKDLGIIFNQDFKFGSHIATQDHTECK